MTSRTAGIPTATAPEQMDARAANTTAIPRIATSMRNLRGVAAKGPDTTVAPATDGPPVNENDYRYYKPTKGLVGNWGAR